MGGPRGGGGGKDRRDRYDNHNHNRDNRRDNRDRDWDRRDNNNNNRGGGGGGNWRDRDNSRRDGRGHGRDNRRDFDRRDDRRNDNHNHNHNNNNPPKPEFDLPCTIRERTVPEHFARHLHRTSAIPRDLIKVVSHWVDTPTGALPSTLTALHNIVIGSDPTAFLQHDGSSPAPAAEEDATLIDAEKRGLENSAAQLPAVCEVRALLVFKSGDGPPAVLDKDSTAEDVFRNTTHMLRTFQVIAEKNQLGDKPYLRGYGGQVSEADIANHTAAAAAISRMTAEQCGATIPPASWRPLLELHYKGGRRVLFLTPSSVEGDAFTAVPQSVTEVTQVEEPTMAVEEDEDADGKEEAAPAAPKMVEKTTQRVVLQPTRVPLMNLVDIRMPATSPVELTELSFASDALYEFLKREMSTRLPQLLEAHAERRRAIDEENAQRRSEVDELKRQNREAVQAASDKRREEEDQRHIEWRKELRGYTIDEKKDIIHDRSESFDTQRRQEERDADAAFRQALDEVERLPYRIVKEVDREAYETLQFFDKLKVPLKEQGTVCERAE